MKMEMTYLYEHRWPPDDNVIIEGIKLNQRVWMGCLMRSGDAVKVLKLNPETGECVAPSLETIANGSYPVSRSLYI